MCFFPDSLQLLSFPLKDSRTLLLLCSKYQQLVLLGTHIFPRLDSMPRDIEMQVKVLLNF